MPLEPSRLDYATVCNTLQFEEQEIDMEIRLSKRLSIYS